MGTAAGTGDIAKGRSGVSARGGASGREAADPAADSGVFGRGVPVRLGALGVGVGPRGVVSRGGAEGTELRGVPSRGAAAGIELELRGVVSRGRGGERVAARGLTAGSRLVGLTPASAPCTLPGPALGGQLPWPGVGVSPRGVGVPPRGVGVPPRGKGVPPRGVGVPPRGEAATPKGVALLGVAAFPGRRGGD